MNDHVTSWDTAGVAISQQQRHKVLRNTYWLLALSLLPTVLGAWIGVSTGITRSLTGGVGLIVFMVGAFGFMFAIEKTKNSAAGVPVLLAFTFFMGLMLSRMIAMVLGFKNGSELIMTAFAGTAGVFFVMASLATVMAHFRSRAKAMAASVILVTSANSSSKVVFIEVLVLGGGDVVLDRQTQGACTPWVKTLKHTALIKQNGTKKG